MILCMQSNGVQCILYPIMEQQVVATHFLESSMLLCF